MARWFLATFVLASCAAAAEQRDWAFIQSVGGMALGTPYRTAEGVLLPVRVNVSGSERITTEPRALHSGIVIERIDARPDGSGLAVQVTTAPAAGKPGRRAASGDVFLGNLAPGRYAVVYAEPNGGRVQVGEITVP